MAVTAISAVVSYGVSTAVTAGVATVIGAGIIATGVGMVAGGIASSLVKDALTPDAPSGGGSYSPSVGLSSPEGARGMLLNSSSNTAPIPVIYGARRLGGPFALPPTVSGSGNQYLNMVVVLSEGEIEAIDTVYLDGVATTDARFSGLVTVEKFLGTDTQAASSTLMAELPTLWSSDHRLLGVAYIYIRLKYDQNAFHSLPTVTADVRGRKLYDPRSATTAYSRNPALMVRDYLTNTRYGRAVPSSAIDDASFEEAADHCDETVAIPGGTQVRYTADGLVNVDDLMVGTLSGMLTACRGTLIYSGGQFKLVQDKAKASTFDFTEDNIIGEWSVKLPGKREKMNRIRARFFNPSKEWQADLAIQENTTYRTQDNNLVLERDVELPFTSDLYRAQQISQIELKQSRIGITCQFTASIAATEVEVGDVVTITHSTPGWSGKLFRIIGIELRQDDEVAITAREYNADVYTLDDLATWTPPPSTTLPDPFTVAAPGTPAVTEALYETSGSAGVKVRATISITPSSDAFVSRYQYAWRATSATEWTFLAESTATTLDVQDVAPGRYDVRARAVNSLGSASEWATRSNVEILGLAAAPANVTGLSLQAAGGLAILTWTLHPDLDVRIGGKIRVRHSHVMTGATWETSVSIGEAVSGSTTVAVLPLKEGTYLVKAEDSSGILSPSAISVSTKQATALTWTTLDTLQEDDDFLGTHTDTIAIDGNLQLAGDGDLIDTVPDFDAISNLDYNGGIKAAGTYDFATGFDLTTVQHVRLTTTVAAMAVNLLDKIDSRSASIDAWTDIDGTTGAPVDAWVEVRSTDDNPAGTPTWSAWGRLDAAEFIARAFDFRAQLVAGDPSYNIQISQLRVKAEQVA